MARRQDRICIWCKYGKEEADKIFTETKMQTMDANKCAKCGKEGISGVFMRDPE